MILMRDMIAACESRRRRLGLVQHAIIAIAHAQPVLERLDMDVGRLGLDRAGDDLVDQPDDRRFAGEILEPLGILLMRLAAAFEIADDLVPADTLLGIEAGERGIELDRHTDLEGDMTAGRGGDDLASKAVDRVSHGDRHRPVIGGERDCMDLAQELRLQPIRQDRFLRIALGTGDLEAEQDRIGFREAALRDEAELDQHEIEPLSGLGRDTPGTVERLRIDEAVLQQQLDERVDRGFRGVEGGDRPRCLDGHGVAGTDQLSFWRKMCR